MIWLKRFPMLAMATAGVLLVTELSSCGHRRVFEVSVPSEALDKSALLSSLARTRQDGTALARWLNGNLTRTSDLVKARELYGSSAACWADYLDNVAYQAGGDSRRLKRHDELAVECEKKFMALQAFARQKQEELNASMAVLPALTGAVAAGKAIFDIVRPYVAGRPDPALVTRLKELKWPPWEAAAKPL